MSLLALCVAFLSSVHLADAVQLFVTLQSLAMVSVEGTKQSPVWRVQLVSIATYASFINFEIEVLKPGCAGGQRRTQRRLLRSCVEVDGC